MNQTGLLDYSDGQLWSSAVSDKGDYTFYLLCIFPLPSIGGKRVSGSMPREWPK